MLNKIAISHYLMGYRPPQAPRGREEAVWGGGEQYLPGVYPQIPAGQSDLDLPETPPQPQGRGEST